MANEITLSVNGTKQVVSAAPETPLLFVLRNELKLTGPRLGCGMAQCGACSVLLDGEEVRACITPISYAVGKHVTTIEGLPAVWAAEKSLSAADAAKTLHPIQQAWIDEQVPQCGYCQSGMIIAAVELLAKNPNPSVAQIKDAFTNKPPSPHLCRCGTYSAIIEAVQPRCQGHEGLRRDCHDCKNRKFKRFPNCHEAHAARLRKNGRRSFRLALDSRRTFPPCRRKLHVA